MKKELYQVAWSQSFPATSLQWTQEELVERMLAHSDFRDANKIISQIKSKLQ